MRDRVRLLWAALAVGGLCLLPAPARAGAPSAKPVPRAETQAEAVQPPALGDEVAAALAPLAEAEAAEAEAARTELAAAAAAEEAAAEAERLEAERVASLPLEDVVAEALLPGSNDVRRIVNWAVASGDHGEVPFIIIDKVTATVFVYDAQGEYLGETPALIGISAGDDATPGSGDRPLSEMGPEEKTTPAGRYAARIGPAAGHSNVLWVDYSMSVALHEVVPGTRRERRAQRLRSVTPDDNRITFGCINVPRAFYREVIRPLFQENGGIVYVLPETRSLEEEFPGLRLRSSWRR